MLCKPYHKLGAQSELLEMGSNTSSSRSLRYNLTVVCHHTCHLLSDSSRERPGKSVLNRLPRRSRSFETTSLRQTCRGICSHLPCCPYEAAPEVQCGSVPSFQGGVTRIHHGPGATFRRDKLGKSSVVISSLLLIPWSVCKRTNPLHPCHVPQCVACQSCANTHTHTHSWQDRHQPLFRQLPRLYSIQSALPLTTLSLPTQTFTCLVT